MERQRDARDLESLLEEQMAYYESRWLAHDDSGAPWMAKELQGLIDRWEPRGRVLELACGTGQWTRELIRYTDTVTALDASQAALELNRKRVSDARVKYVLADVFEWEPDEIFDCVFFAFWLSHVPPERFEAFWDLVAMSLGQGGRVLFTDEDARSTLDEESNRFVSGETPCVRRVLEDGRQFEIVKVFWRAQDLQHRLSDLGWAVSVEPFLDMFLVGSGSGAG